MSKRRQPPSQRPGRQGGPEGHVMFMEIRPPDDIEAESPHAFVARAGGPVEAFRAIAAKSGWRDCVMRFDVDDGREGSVVAPTPDSARALAELRRVRSPRNWIVMMSFVPREDLIGEFERVADTQRQIALRKATADDWMFTVAIGPTMYVGHFGNPPEVA